MLARMRLDTSTKRSVCNSSNVVPVLALFVSLWSAPVRAHEKWLELEPPRPTAVPEAGLKVYLLTGEALKSGELLPERRRGRFLRFERLAAGPAGRRDLRDALREDQQPLAVVPKPALVPGTMVLALDTAPADIELPAEKFSAYLLEERLIDVLTLRAQRGEEDTPGRERYARCLKALVRVGEGGSAATQVVGQTLELVPLVDPVTAAPGAEVPVQVLLRGQPLPGRAVVLASRRVGDVRVVHQRSDSRGQVRLRLDRDGDFLVSLVHMEPAEEPGTWRSLWSSLAFSRPAPPRQ